MWTPWPQCQVLIRFKLSQSIQACSNIFQIISNLVRSKKGLPNLKKFDIKYSSEGFEDGNNFLHRNLFIFERDFELQIWEVRV
jgi:hypothetical protein